MTTPIIYTSRDEAVAAMRQQEQRAVPTQSDEADIIVDAFQKEVARLTFEINRISEELAALSKRTTSVQATLAGDDDVPVIDLSTERAIDTE